MWRRWCARGQNTADDGTLTYGEGASLSESYNICLSRDNKCNSWENSPREVSEKGLDAGKTDGKSSCDNFIPTESFAPSLKRYLATFGERLDLV